MTTEYHQRTVNNKLGKNIVKDHSKLYAAIETIIGPFKKCTFGHVRGSKTGVKHEGDPNVSIRDFELRGIMYDELSDTVIFEKGSDGLQGFCRVCSKKRRKSRIQTNKMEKQGKTVDEICDMYIQKYGITTKKCSRCAIDKDIHDYNLSIGMECGLHNVCKECAHEYGSSVGDRWIIYLPDGVFKYNKKDVAETDDMHDDHIFPLSLGGSNEEINHRLISSSENLSKSNSIDMFNNIAEIDPKMLSLRYQHILATAEYNTIQDFKIRLTSAVYNDISERNKLSDTELFEVYDSYCKKNNLRCDVNRAVRKFKEFCKERNIV
jgi:hypothetical protein